ncbi:MAG: hypothetical protein NWQ53_06790 [Flavobacteriales bacterium]|nr:hypothetical protein [Flavobacteriales bacterium]
MIKYKFLSIALLCFISIQSSAKENLIDFERRIDKTQSVQAGADFEISSSFSDIDYQTWDKNEIQITVILSVNTKNEKDAERFFEKVDIDYQASSSRVKLKTKWEGNWNSSKDGSFKIQLIVFAPSSINLDLKHSFGATSINEITNAKIDSEYGSLDIGACMGTNNRLEVSFGSVSIGSLDGGELDVEYGDAKIGKVQNDCEFNVSFSNATITLMPHFSGEIEVNNSYSDCDVYIQKDQGINFTYSASFGDVSYPKYLSVVKKDKEMFSEEIECNYGNSALKLLVNNSFGDFKLKSQN